MTVITSTTRKHTPEVREVPCSWCNSLESDCSECGNTRLMHTHDIPELALDIHEAAALFSMVGLGAKAAFRPDGLELAKIPDLRRNIVVVMNSRSRIDPYVPLARTSADVICWLHILNDVLVYAQAHEEDVFWE